MSEEAASERAVQHRNEILSSLLKVEAFQALEVELQRQEKEMGDAFMRALLSDTASDPQRLLDQHRGFVRGLRYAMSVPRASARSLRGGTPEEEEETEMEDGWAKWAR